MTPPRSLSTRRSRRERSSFARPRADVPVHLLPVLLSSALLCTAPALAQELYPSSVVGTDFDVLREDDPDAFSELEFVAKRRAEMPDKRGDTPLLQEAWVFRARFTDGTRVQFALDGGFPDEASARAEALRYTSRLGKLPTALRRGVERVVVHRGGEDTTAFSDAGLIVLYADNATRRIETHDLEETLFHESVHAAWDAVHARSQAWRAAQEQDGRFVTRYAARHPQGEDLAESALLAFALIHHPERIPEADAARIRAAIPARIAFVAGLLPQGRPLIEAEPSAPSPRPTGCSLDAATLETAAGIADVLSNALTLGLGQDEAAVQAFLRDAVPTSEDAQALFAAAAQRFELPAEEVEAQARAYRHVNCEHD